MLSSKIIDLLTKQVGIEFHNSNVYFTISKKMKLNGLMSLGAHYDKQANEERGHGTGVADYLNRSLVDFSVPAVPASPTEPESNIGELDTINWLSDVLTLERETTRQVNAIMNQAISEKDNATQDFMQDYIREQVNEEYEASTLLSLAGSVGTNVALLDLWVKEHLL